MTILGIESSCDETSAAIVEEGVVLSNVVQGQVEVHAEYGGVVPELASRAHIHNIYPVITEALLRAGRQAADLTGIAVTAGPGLIGGLLVGLALAKGLALALQKPLIGIHHMEGHLMSPFLRLRHETPSDCTFPFVALLVSGGHTWLLHAKAFGDYELLGQTRDDAAGEAFDKGARLLGLPYPGGPAIAALANGGDAQAIRFPRAWLDRQRFDFSFSGLKTALRTHLLNHPPGEDLQTARDIAASYQEALVEVLVEKALAACRAVGCTRLLVAGGVGANQRLRELLQQKAGQRIAVYAPPLAFCTDNGAMIALAGEVRLLRGERSDDALTVRPRWPIGEVAFFSLAKALPLQ
ncbi:MAG: tRNA (adenosine(37)-N6)-threonylcarbamoyltransferase complex transferase subunit TsaD [Magnetococcales bacterium]|nr:tRNA (adenosine(37)-N6)-threonylcarbamoyltransferase complex transferase subunit TsaD [Magnetococcales bacterium]MBF0115610.1 tRNA (adenosine(37)-N6)-threonylcarbamoyltransferase complex transferase subunit TsaD [Magnetococcales bacterium]